MKVELRESCQFIESGDASGSFTVRIIAEGQGSSGVYTRGLLEKSASLFANVPSFRNHPVDGDPTKRDFLDIVGMIGDTWYSVENGIAGIYGKFTPLSEYASKFSQLKDKIGLSIFTSGRAVEAEDGSVIIESFDEVDNYRSVDVVIAPGAGGSFAPIMESLRHQGGDNRKEDEMTEAIEKGLADLASKFDQFLATQAVAPEPIVQPTEDEIETAKAEAVAAYAEAAAAIDAAELAESQKVALKAEAAKGVDVTAAIESQVAIRKEVLAEAQATSQSGGYQVIQEGKTFDPLATTVKGWR